MVKCAVKCSKNDTRKHTKHKSSITFHRFPKDRNRMTKWIDAVKQTNWEPNIWSKICSMHFSDSSMYETKNGLRRITLDAVPSLFLNESPSSGSKLVEVPSQSDPVKDAVTLPLAQQCRSVSICHPTAYQSAENVTSTPRKRKLNKEIGQSGDLAKRRRLSSPHDQQFSIDQTIHSVDPSNITDTPRKKKLKNEISRLKDVAKRRRLRCNALYAALRRLKKKVENLSQVLEELKEKRLINQEQVDLLESCGVSAAALMKRMLHKGKEYSPELRTFALTLNFYSPKAYSYIRSTFNTCLPHPSTIRKWYQCVNASPGFTAEAFKVLEEKAKSSDKKVLCNLVLDEMSIRQLKEFDGNAVQGYVDFGPGIDAAGDSLELCTQALVFLLVAINEKWKMPVGYFLVNGVTDEQRANLVRMCLSNCHDVAVEVVSMTFDGCPANIAMARELGCTFDPQVGLKTYFPDPVTDQPVYVFFDACHMVKLVRNTLESQKVLRDNNGGLIKWQYLVELNNLQLNENFHLANKLTTRHIDFKGQIMKVKLAVQLLSASVAKAIDFCDKELHLLNFSQCDATVEFINVINNLFDILNSRKFPGIDYKAPINEKNETKYLTFLENTKTYLEHLMLTKNEQLVVYSRNKIGFLGLCVCITSMKELYNRLVKREKILSFIPMYKVSQDHLEILFSVIRSHGGFNNNPSALQFRAIYKKLLVHLELKENFRGNCAPLEHITLLTCSSSAHHINMTTKGHRSKSQEDMIDEQYMSKLDEEDLNVPSIPHSFLSEHVVSYIAGYVVRFLLSNLDCIECLGALVARAHVHSHSFIIFKDRGGLIYPSDDVIKICNAAESVLKINIDAKNKIDRDPRSMVSKTLKLFIGTDIFKVLHSHLFEQEPCSNHLLHLLRAVVQKYVQIRLKYLVRKSNVKETKRQLYNKLTLFKGQ